MVESQEIELQGHIIDSGIMTQLFERVMDMGGNFEILTFDVGKKKTDPSYARLKIVAQDKEKLRSILSEFHGSAPVSRGAVRPLRCGGGDRTLPGDSIQRPTTRPR